VHSAYSGCENRFELDTRLRDIRQYLEFVSEQWDQALSRLKSKVMRSPGMEGLKTVYSGASIIGSQDGRTGIF
jgi:hypothetical protein